MNVPLRRVTVVMVILFSLLFLNLNWVQFVQHDYYKNNAYNHRVTIEEYSRQRGAILAGSETIAKSVATENSDLKYQREYPGGKPYAHLTGYQSLAIGNGGLENAQNDLLSGNAAALFVQRMRSMVTGEEVVGGNVILSVDPKLQEKAWDLLQNSSTDVAAAVAMDPQTGQVLAQVSTPSYDPTPLASHDVGEAQSAWNDLTADDSGNPVLDRSTNELYPPGSTMKVLVAAAALESGLTPDSMVPAGNEYVPPHSSNNPIRNASNQCPESELPLKEALARSCNTSFAELCVNDFNGKVDDGAETMTDMAHRFGFDEEVETPLRVEPSQLGDVSAESFLARACFGQHEVRVTPMQNAMIAAAIANDGDMMKPQVIKETQDSDKTSLSKTGAHKINSPVSGSVAKDLRTMMKAVVDNGTGTDARIDGKDVGGKTGTAERGVDDNGNPLPEHGWFMGYAMDDDEPQIAVSVVLTNTGEGGSSEATRIGGELMKAGLKE